MEIALVLKIIMSALSISYITLVYFKIRQLHGETKNLVMDYASIKLALLSKTNEVDKLQKSIEEARPESVEVKELLADLAHGNALVKISRVNPSDFYLKRPSDRG